MKTIPILFLVHFIFNSHAFAQEKSASSGDLNYTAYNRTMTTRTDSGRTILSVSEGLGPGLAWVNGLEFSEGTIQFDAKGRDVLQESFLGIAFHGVNNKIYETIYLRPFNFQAKDPVRKIHAVQYTFEPEFGFQQLRNTQKDKYESAIVPSNIDPSSWFHVKVEVRNNTVTVFLNDAMEPCLKVSSLNDKPVGKKIGFWVGNGSNGDFANLKISK
jgi:hypothetical protein